MSPRGSSGSLPAAGRLARAYHAAVAAGLVWALGATVAAFQPPIFALGKRGLLGVALGETAVNSYSMIDGALNLLVASPSSPEWLMRGYFLLYSAMLLLAPLLWYAGSLLVWVVPLTPAARHDAGYWLQLLYSFNVLEVYLVCMVLSLLQLDAMAQQIAGEMSQGSCEAASQVLEDHFGDLVQPPTCLTLASGLLSAYWLLLAATLVGIPAGLVVARRLEEEEEEELSRRSGGSSAGDTAKERGGVELDAWISSEGGSERLLPATSQRSHSTRALV